MDIGSLASWDDFIHAISGDKPARPPRRYLSMVRCSECRIIGPSDGHVQGHFHASTRATTNSLSILLMAT